MTRGRRRQVFGSDLCFCGGLEDAPETIVVARGHLEGGARVPLPASRCTRASFRLRQVDEVQAEPSASMFRDGTYGPALCLCPAPKVEDHRATDAKHLVRGPQQATFENVSLAARGNARSNRSLDEPLASVVGVLL